MMVLSRSKKAAVRSPPDRARAGARSSSGPVVSPGDSSAWSSAFSVVSTGTEDRGSRKTPRHSAYSRACGFVFLAARVHHGSHGSFATVLTRSGSSPPSRAVDRRPPLSPPAGVVARPGPFSGLEGPRRRMPREARPRCTGGIDSPARPLPFVTLRCRLLRVVAERTAGSDRRCAAVPPGWRRRPEGGREPAGRSGVRAAVGRRFISATSFRQFFAD